MQRPDWTDYFLGLAEVVAQRSLDQSTKIGCIITDPSNHIVGTGYNSFARKGKNDDSLPLTRPEKYSWMIHAEENALANCVLRPTGCTAYITSQCCSRCIQMLWQNGIESVYMIKGRKTRLLNDKTQQAVFDRFVEDHDINIYYVTPDLSWLKRVADGVS